MINKPLPLFPGARVALVAPSGPLPEGRLMPALDSVRALDLEPVVYPSCEKQHGYFAGGDEQRARDINDAFADDSIQGILCMRGGYGAQRLMDRLDWKLIAEHPKVFCGYSDITALHIQLPDNLVITWLKSYPAYLLLLLLEPLLLHTWGYTPGKWLLGLKVRDRNGEKLTLRRARQRTWRLFGRGEGYNILFYNFVREWKSYRTCRDGEPLPWDRDDALPVEDDISYVAEELKVRQFAGWVAAVVAVLILAVQVGLCALLPPCRGELTVAEFSRNYNYYANLLDQDVPALDEKGAADPTWGNLLDSALGWYSPSLTLDTDGAGKVTGLTVTWVSRPDAGVYGVPDQSMVNVLAASLLGAREGWWVVRGFTDDLLDFSDRLSDLPMEGGMDAGDLNLERKLDVRTGKLNNVGTNHDFYEPVGTEDVHALLILTARIPE